MAEQAQAGQYGSGVYDLPEAARARRCSSTMPRAVSEQRPQHTATGSVDWTSLKEAAPSSTAARISRSVTALQRHTYIVDRMLNVNENDCQ